MNPAERIAAVEAQLAACRTLAVAALRRDDVAEWNRWLATVARVEERLEELSAARAA